MHGLALLLLLSLPVFATDEGPTQQLPGGEMAYYGEGFPRNLGNDIKAGLFVILSSRHSSSPGRPDQIGGSCDGRSRGCYQHTPVGYSNARNLLFGELYNQRDSGGGSYVVEVYCEKVVRFRSLSDISGMNNIVNIEHTWPQSKFSERFPKEMQKSDLHHLYPSDSKANGVRGNFEFGEERGITVENCPASHFSDSGPRGRTFTPPPAHRGNVARAMFYFSVRYQMPIDRDQEAVLREWHRDDPVDEREVWRHNLIARRQNTRNPFVDHPELVDWVRDF